MSHCWYCGNTVQSCACGSDSKSFSFHQNESLSITDEVQTTTAEKLANIQLGTYSVPMKYENRISVLDKKIADKILTEIKDAATAFLRKGQFLDNGNLPFIKRPWALNASALKSEKSLSAVFKFRCSTIENTNLPSVFVDRFLGKHFHSSGDVHGLNLAVNVKNGTDRIIPVFVKPDGKWENETVRYVLEIKTVRTRENFPYLCEGYLQQMAAYQLLRYENPENTPEEEVFLLVVIVGLETLLVFKVHFENLIVCAKEWSRWFKKLSVQSFKVDQLISFFSNPISIQTIKSNHNNARIEEEAKSKAKKEKRRRVYRRYAIFR
jgi:hypothetical protein